jgi:chromosome segregation ATPase
MLADQSRPDHRMSNAKIAALIAEANQTLIADIDRVLSPIIKELAEMRVELEVLQSAIAPMATELERLRSTLLQTEQMKLQAQQLRAELGQQGAGAPPK